MSEVDERLGSANGRHNAMSAGSKSTKIGILPGDWDVIALGDLAEPNAPIRYGVVQIGPDTPDGVPIVPIKFINQIDAATLHRASKAIEGRYAGSRVQEGDVLLSVKGTIGRVGVVPEGFQGNIAREIARIRLRNSVDPYFIALQLQAPQTQRRIGSATVGSTRLEFSIAEVRDFLVALPPLAEQHKIAKLLGAWGEAIEQTSRLIEVERLLFSAKAREFFDPCHPTFTHRPNDWRPFTLGEVFCERDETSDKEELLLSITMKGGVIDREDVGRKDTSTEDKSHYKLILPGDIGYNTMRMWQGVAGLSSMRGLVSPAYTVVIPDNKNILAEYAAQFFKSRRMVFDFERYSQGLTSDTWSIKFPSFAKIKVYLPPIEIQRRQARLLDAMNEKIALLDREAHALRRQRRGLMQKLLTGEWRIKLDTTKTAETPRASLQ